MTPKQSPLDAAMQANNLGQTALAAQVDVSVSTVQKWLRRSRFGQGGLPTMEQGKMLELVLSVPDCRKLFPLDWPQ